MSNVHRILSAIEQGDQAAAKQLLPLVYDELRELAARRLAQEKPGQTLQPTALVHEAYLRLVGPAGTGQWDNRGHFFAAPAEAMRRILIENARRKNRQKHGGGLRRVELTDDILATTDTANGKQPPLDPTTPWRFHSLRDAAAWIQQNWPDFDLETNYPATWRGSC